MATAKTPPSGWRTTKQKANTVLRAEHTLVDNLFKRFEVAHALTTKQEIVAEICTELSAHARLEEDIFYPEVKAALRDHRLIHEAEVEHQSLKELMAQLKNLARTTTFTT